MKTTALLSLALLGGMLIGCEKESAPGGPGAQTKTPSTPDGTATPNAMVKEQTFKLEVPRGETDIKQGGKEDITLKIDRGKEFTQNVKLAFKLPTGVTVAPADPVIQTGNKELKVSLEAAKDAPAGKHQIEVTATPETGAAVKQLIALEVAKAG